MNILPLIFAFILIFAIGSYTFVHNHLCAIQERRHFFSAVSASHSYARTMQTKRFRKIKGENLHPRKPPKEKLKKLDYQSHRDRQTLCLQAKLNIAPMLAGQSSKLEALLVDFIDHIYRFFPEKEQKNLGALLLELIKKAKNLKNLVDLLEIVEEQDREIVYKMLKGTKHVDLSRSVGYPALEDYIYIGEKKKPVCVAHACRPLLEVVFGSHIVPLIVQEEHIRWEAKHKHVPITRNELVPILLSRNCNLLSIEELIDFSMIKAILEEEGVEFEGN